MSAKRAIIAAPMLLAALALPLAGCSSSNPSSQDSDSESGSGSETISVVSSTNVWGDLAATVGGDAVDVTSIIDSPDKDPHEYEANSKNQLALSKADVVIENGGGYDDFVGTMLDSAKNDSAEVLDAVEISGKTAADGEELNEHVWYDLPTVEKVVDEIADAYAKIDPDQADDFQKNADDLKSDLQDLEAQEEDAKSSVNGAGVAITEPVPLYLLEAVGAENRTPDEFSEAIEEDTDVPANVLDETLKLFSDHQVQALVYNEQTTGPQTEAVLDAAKKADVAVVPVTETLPEGKTYTEWMGDNISAVVSALSES